MIKFHCFHDQYFYYYHPVLAGTITILLFDFEILILHFLIQFYINIYFNFLVILKYILIFPCFRLISYVIVK